MLYHLNVPLTPEEQATVMRWQIYSTGFYTVISAVLLVIAILHSYLAVDTGQIANQSPDAVCARCDHLRSE